MNILRHLGLALVLTATTVLAAPAHAEPVRIVLLSAPIVDAAPGEPLPPFRVRVERANGEPLAGVQIYYDVDICITVATPVPGSECPDQSEYGGFNDGANLGVVVTTGSDGTVTTPIFRAGNPRPQNLPFEFSVFPYASTQTTPGGFTITLQDAVNPIGGLLNAATRVRIGGEGPAAEVPALDGVHLLVLGLLLAAVGAWRLRSLAGAR